MLGAFRRRRKAHCLAEAAQIAASFACLSRLRRRRQNFSGGWVLVGQVRRALETVGRPQKGSDRRDASSRAQKKQREGQRQTSDRLKHFLDESNEALLEAERDFLSTSLAFLQVSRLLAWTPCLLRQSQSRSRWPCPTCQYTL